MTTADRYTRTVDVRDALAVADMLESRALYLTDNLARPEADDLTELEVTMLGAEVRDLARAVFRMRAEHGAEGELPCNIAGLIEQWFTTVTARYADC